MNSERELYPIIEKYLVDQGFKVFLEASVDRWFPSKVDVMGINPKSRELTSVEAKLGWWRRTVKQAFDRLFFSDTVFVAFPKEYAKYARNKAIATLSKTGIGLMEVGDSVSILIPAKPSNLLNALRKERIVKKFLEPHEKLNKNG